MSNANRNEPCPCGSGEKRKHCHPKGYEATSRNRKVFLIGGGLAAVIVASVILLRPDTPAPLPNVPAGPVTTTTTQSGGTPQPPGPAPAGKVWSPEHGHWHDAPVAGAPVGIPLGSPAGTPAGTTPATSSPETAPASEAPTTTEPTGDTTP